MKKWSNLFMNIIDKMKSKIISYSKTEGKSGLLGSLHDEIPKEQRVLVAVLFFFSAIIFLYLCWRNNSIGIAFANLIKDLVPLLLLSWMAGLVIASGRVDISIGGVSTLSGVVFATSSYFNPLIGIFFACITGLAFGCFNGFLVSKKHAPSLLVTWAIGIVSVTIAGIVTYAAYYNKISTTISSVNLPWVIPANPFVLGGEYFLSFLYVGFVVGVFIIVFRLGVLSRLLGANIVSAEYSGFDIDKITVYIFGITGVLSSVAGLLMVLSTGSANSTAMVGKEMVAIAIAVLGGTSMSGGYYSTTGIFIAAVFWVLIDSVLAGANFGLGIQESRVVVTFFSVVIIFVSVLLGKKMSGITRNIQVDKESYK